MHYIWVYEVNFIHSSFFSGSGLNLEVKAKKNLYDTKYFLHHLYNHKFMHQMQKYKNILNGV
jgi:hypothetical protein